MAAVRASWDLPPERQVRCRSLAVAAWCVLGAWFFFVLIGSWGSIVLASNWWAMGAIPVAYATHRWLNRYGEGRAAAAATLFALCTVLFALSIVGMAVDDMWPRFVRHFLAYILFSCPIVLSLSGAALGFMGRRTSKGF